MFSRSVPLVILLCSTLVAAPAAHAQVPITRAVVESIRNRVQLLLRQQSPRAARISDVMTPGDGLTTAQSSLAELRFNDGSLGRLGEQVVFWFTPGSRTFQLSNGTVLMLIPPGRGRTQIRTPNAAAGIQGSALFVRYIAASNTTVVGALTDSGIEVFNQDGSQQQTLEAGQMAVAIDGRIAHVYDFDLTTFYETSELMRGLTPSDVSNLNSDNGIALVHAEMQAALEQNLDPMLQDEIGAPSFIRLPDDMPERLDEFWQNQTAILQPDDFSREVIAPPQLTDLAPGRLTNSALDIRTLLDVGELQRTIENDRGGFSRGGIDIVDSPVSPPFGQNDFPDRGNGVVDGFPGQGNGVVDGFPGQGNGVVDGFPGQGGT